MFDKSKITKPELLAPAGNWEMLSAAVKNGADAVYLGVDKLNMRAKAKNFTVEHLEEVVEFCKDRNVDVHLTLNTIVYEDELRDLDEIIPAAKRAGVALVICWDNSVIQKCIEYEMPFCISTQASISNSASIKFYENLGATRVVLARECTLKQIKEIKENTDIEIEAFVHGAMCVAVSGRCFMSHYAFGNSANRGECIQPCRREFEIKDTNGESSYVIGSDYVMSPKDLCTVGFIDQLIEAGIDSFKIEGRKRSPEYIAKVVSVYREAIDLYYEKRLTKEKKDHFIDELGKVYNRGFSTGFYFGTPGKDEFANKYGSQATTKKIYIGKVINYFKKSGIAHVLLEAGDLKMYDNIYVIGNATGVLETKVKSIVKDEARINLAEKGNDITFPVPERVRLNDKVYKIVKVNEQ